MQRDSPRVQPVQRVSLVETAYENILEAILSGRLKAGDEVSEVSLAAELNISRTPVAHAMQKLAAAGLIDRPAGKPPRVAEFDRDEVAEIYEMRELLEAEAAARAATLLPQERLEALMADAEELAGSMRSANWAERAVRFDVRFHDEVASASGNRRLCEQIRTYRLLVRAFCRSTGRKENLRHALDEHRQILAAIAARKPQAARAAMAEHVAKRKKVVLTELYPEEE